MKQPGIVSNHDQLEQRVQQRTAELAQANQALQAEIAGHKRTEEQLRVQTTALDAAANAIMITDHNGTIQSVNPAFTALTGYTAQEAVGQNPRIVKSGKYDEAFYRNLWQTISSGRVWRRELTNRRKDGSLYDEEMTITPLRNADGVIARYIAIKQDITERRRAESLVRQSEGQYRSLFDNARDAIFTIAVDGTFTSLNPAVETMAGLLRADWIGKPFAPMVHPDDLPLAREMFSRILQGEQTPVHELRGNPNLKRPALMEMTLTPQKDENGKIIGLLGIGRDITEQKRAEEELRASQKKFQDLFESSRDAIMTSEPPSWKFTSGNPAAVKMFGAKSEEEFISHRPWELSPERQPDGRASAEKAREMIETAMREGSNFFEWTHRRIGGEEFPATVLISRMQSGEKVFHQATVRDVTEQKRLEAQLFQSQKMETVGKLAGGIAHEFNSILTAIIGQSELLLNDLPSGSPLCKNATEIRNAADRAAILTRQLLAYGRKQILQPEILDLNSILAGMDGMLRHLMGGEVEMQIVPAIGLQAVKADAGQIEQVIINMAMNAADAMPDGGKLTLETANVTLDQEYVGRVPDLKAGGYVMLAITDTGAGMSEEVKARVFEPFFTTKGVGQGTGLGLSTCYGILKQSGGHINVYSELGRGTTFKIYLPQVEPRAKIPAQRSAAPDLPHGTETILLVEDDPALREMAAMLLRRLGYTVLTAAHGIEALSLIAAA